MEWNINGEKIHITYWCLLKFEFMYFIGDFSGFRPYIKGASIPNMCWGAKGEEGEGGFKLGHVNYIQFISIF